LGICELSPAINEIGEKPVGETRKSEESNEGMTSSNQTPRREITYSGSWVGKFLLFIEKNEKKNRGKSLLNSFNGKLLEFCGKALWFRGKISRVLLQVITVFFRWISFNFARDVSWESSEK
jgi:hypothetical protein